MDINITSNVQNHIWSGVASHVDRDYKNDKNKGINPSLTKYNKMLSTDDLSKVINQHFKPLVEAHNSSKSVKKNPQRAYKSVRDYLKRRKGKPESTIVLKIGGLDDKDRIRAMVQGTDFMTKPEAIRKVKRADNYAFRLYVNGYKKRHPLGKSFIPMGHAETNEDEAGADHLHYNIADLGFTPKGNASMGFSRALCNEYHTKDRLKAMRIWHSKEDPALLECMNKSYQKLISPDISFNLKRSGHAYHLEQPLYKDAMKIKDKELQRLEPAVNSLIKQNGRLKKEEKELLKKRQMDGRLIQKLDTVCEWQTREMKKLRKSNRLWYKQAMKDRSILLRYQHLYKNQRQKITLLLGSVQSFNDSLKMPTEWLKRRFGELLDTSTRELLKSKKKKN